MIGFFHSGFLQGSYKLLHVLVLSSFCSLNNITLYGYKITADGYCSHEIKTQLLFGRKAMTSLDSILKSRDITLPRKVCLVKANIFPGVIYGYEN